MNGDIFIYGVIGDQEGEVSFENIKTQIQASNASEELTLHIISPGGDVWEGFSIYNALKNTGKIINVCIEGVCASIATLIAGAGDRITMNRTAQFMVHNPHITGLTETAESKDLRNVADQLDQIKSLLINVYKKRTGLSEEKLHELYDNETWLTADQAAQMGFIDESVDAIKAVAKLDLTKFRNDMKDQKQTEGLFARFANLLKGVKIKNEATETLADGTVVIILTDDGDFTGKQVMYEDGSAVPAGEHPLESGRVIVVDDASVITEVREVSPEEKATEEDMKLKEENESLKAKIAEYETKINELTGQKAEAEAKTLKIENRVKTVEKDFLKLKEEVSQTFGDAQPVNIKGSFKNQEEQEGDPMGDFAKQFLVSHNRIKK